MVNLSSEYWNKRYQENEFGWDLGSVSPPIKEYVLQLKDKNSSILIPGAGNSYEAEFLYNYGFKNIDVLDFAEEPLQNLKRRIPSFPVNQLIQANFFDHSKHYDLIFEQTFFCALNPDLREQYVTHMAKLLKPNGKLVGVLFDDELNTDKPPFGGNKNEYQALFASKFDLETLEPCYNSVKPRQGRELFVIFKKK